MIVRDVICEFRKKKQISTTSVGNVHARASLNVCRDNDDDDLGHGYYVCVPWNKGMGVEEIVYSDKNDEDGKKLNKLRKSRAITDGKD